MSRHSDIAAWSWHTFLHSVPTPVWLGLGITLLLVILSFFWPARPLRYRSTPILTANEQEFFQRLLKAYSEGFIFPQVGMAALITPNEKDRKRWGMAFAKISQKRVDFAIYDEALSLICIIELDDKTHDLQKDRARDALTQSAGIRTLRYLSKAKPSIKQLNADITAVAQART